MNPIEKTIRTALERGDADDRAFREKVYRSVYAALEKSIAANPDLPDDAVEHRREMLKSSIRAVEQEFVPAFEPEEPEETVEPIEPEDVPVLAPAAPGHAFDAFPQAPARSEPRSSWAAASNRYYEDEGEPSPRKRPRQPRQTVVIQPTPQPRYDDEIPLPDIEPRQSRGYADFGDGDPGLGDLVARREGRRDDRRDDDRRYADREPAEREPRRRRGRFFLMLFLVATVLAAGAMGIWWAMDTGLFLSAEERDTSVPNPPLTLEDEEFQPAGPPPLSEQEAAEGPGDDWITVFSPTDPTRAITPAGGSAEVIEIEGGMALRIRSPSPDEPVRFEIGEGILQEIAGRSAVFNIKARTDAGQETQILVTCDFGPLGDCGRSRYFVSSENRDFAVGRDMADARPTGAGSIQIVSDASDGGRTVDIIEIRVAVPD